MKNQPSSYFRKSFDPQIFRWFALALLTLVLSPCNVASAKSCCTVCQCKAQEVWCEERGLTSLPVDIPSNIKRLFIFSNNISSIPNHSLAHLKDLEMLDLRSNKLTTDGIGSNAFSELHQLQDLLLSDNKISRIHRSMFLGLRRLARLYVEENAIEHIEEGSFSNFKHLLELKLSHNRLSHFPQISNCPNLRRLHINENRLVRLEPKTLVHLNLEELALSRNLLNQLPSSVFNVTKNMNMRELDLSQNRISRIPRVISKMSLLRTLNLSGNPIASLPRDFLKPLRRMKVLELRGLKLTTLAKGFIPTRVYLNIFGISNNPWHCNCDIAWLLKYMRILSGVFVQKNQIRCHAPSKLHGRQLSTLHENDLNCDGFLTSDSLDETKTPPSGPGVNGPCDGFTCANGGKCVLKPGISTPSCRCLPGWSGVSCQTVLSAAAPNGAISTSNKGKLLIEPESVTSDSVKIIFPITGKDIKITAVELAENGVGWRIVRSFNPTKNVYIFDGLKSKTRYQICISSAELGDASINEDTDQDRLCVKITTLDLDKDTNANGISKQKELFSSHVNDKNDQMKTELDGVAERTDLSQRERFNILYPIIGACVAVCIIVVCTVFIIFRRKQGRARNEENGNQMVNSSEPANPKLMQLTLEQTEPMFKPNSNHNSTIKNISNVFGAPQCMDQKQNHFYTCPRSFETNTSNRYDSLCKCSFLNDEKLNYTPTVVNEIDYHCPNSFDSMQERQFRHPKLISNQASVCDKSISYNSPPLTAINTRSSLDSSGRHGIQNTPVSQVYFPNFSLKRPPPTSSVQYAPSSSVTCDNLLENHRIRTKDSSMASPSAKTFSPSSNLQLQNQLSDKNFYLNCELHNCKMQSGEYPCSYTGTKEPSAVSTMVI